MKWTMKTCISIQKISHKNSTLETNLWVRILCPKVSKLINSLRVDVSDNETDHAVEQGTSMMLDEPDIVRSIILYMKYSLRL